MGISREAGSSKIGIKAAKVVATTEEDPIQNPRAQDARLDYRADCYEANGPLNEIANIDRTLAANVLPDLAGTCGL